MPRSSTDWTLEAIQTLRTLWAEGHSTAEIGRRMGLSKNAVVGKAHRLNLPARPSPITRGDPRPRKVPAQRHKPSIPPLQLMHALPKAVEVERPPLLTDRSLAALANRREAGEASRGCCCWPIGEPGRPDFGFCGDPVEALGRPYCDDHRGIAYVPKKPKQRQQQNDRYART